MLVISTVKRAHGRMDQEADTSAMPSPLARLASRSQSLAQIAGKMLYAQSCSGSVRAIYTGLRESCPIQFSCRLSPGASEACREAPALHDPRYHGPSCFRFRSRSRFPSRAHRLLPSHMLHPSDRATNPHRLRDALVKDQKRVRPQRVVQVRGRDRLVRDVQPLGHRGRGIRDRRLGLVGWRDVGGRERCRGRGGRAAAIGDVVAERVAAVVLDQRRKAIQLARRGVGGGGAGGGVVAESGEVEVLGKIDPGRVLERPAVAKVGGAVQVEGQDIGSLNRCNPKTSA